MQAQTFTTLINANELAELLNSSAKNIRIFDCRFNLQNKEYGKIAFLQGHINTAQYFDLEKDLSGVADGRNGRHPLPDANLFAKKLGQFGVDNDCQIIAYDDDNGVYASRLWWMMKWIGHKKCAVLNGGIKNWQNLFLPITTNQTPKFPEKNFQSNINNLQTNIDEVLENIKNPTKLIIDARSPDRFAGENETLDPVGGHIPNAKNRFYGDNLENNLFKNSEKLKSEWQNIIGNTAPEKIIHQCGSGVTACHNLLAMEYAGLFGSKLFAGSWSMWCADKLRPIATGKE